MADRVNDRSPEFAKQVAAAEVAETTPVETPEKTDLSGGEQNNGPVRG